MQLLKITDCIDNCNTFYIRNKGSFYNKHKEKIIISADITSIFT